MMWQIILLNLVASFVAPYIWTRNPKISLLITLTDGVLMYVLGVVLGWL